jgi:hypothetical protein
VSVDYLTITGNSALAVLTDLSGLTEVTTSVMIFGNPSLPMCQATLLA